MSSQGDSVSERKRQDLLNYTHELIRYVEEAATQPDRALHEVEHQLWERLLLMGRCAEEYFIQSCGLGDEGEALVDERTERRLIRFEVPHTRQYQSVFGLLEIPRFVYGAYERQKIERAPLDARLQLPENSYSYLLQDWSQSLAIEMPFGQVQKFLNRMLNNHLSTHSLERFQHGMADHSSDFWSQLDPPDPAKDGALIVATNDGKGIPMRRATRARASGEAMKGATSSDSKPGTKKMALISAVYSVDRYVRTPKEVWDALFQTDTLSPSDGEASKRPKPYGKRVRGLLQRDDDETTEPQTVELAQWQQEEIERRDPEQEKPVVVVMDGQDSLWKSTRKYLRTGVIEILDVMHACSYLWKAAELLQPHSKPTTLNWVQGFVYLVLDGHIRLLLDLLPALADQVALMGKKRIQLEKILGYLRHNAHRMKYDEYLREGYPIASGIIEGACRCLVKDRMERSGMRWRMQGARAMLNLRSIHLSDLWDSFQSFRIQQENRRLYPYASHTDDEELAQLASILA